MEYARKHGPEATARFMIKKMPRSADLDARKRGAVFITAMLSHRVSNWHEQPYGYVAKCSNCEQVVKVPREPADGFAGIQGRAVERLCPVALAQTRNNR